MVNQLTVTWIRRTDFVQDGIDAAVDSLPVEFQTAGRRFLEFLATPNPPPMAMDGSVTPFDLAIITWYRGLTLPEQEFISGMVRALNRDDI